ncbi:sorbitol-6-phosphate 2-dehydrogenase [Tetragenococcus halophilus subsp. flandriensis]|nr:sorbitol-6-phosphate 2-dehydrogenase [Tetragenococcus halophilus subsp. flandriensis]
MGIGESVVNNLLDNEAQIIIADRVENEKLLTRDNVSYIPCDITKKVEVESFVEKVIGNYKKIDGLVNNAGANRPNLLVDYYNGDSEHEMSEEELDLMYQVNQKGLFLMTQAVAREMIKQKEGVIINISSEAGMEGSKGQGGYSATKGAVNSFTLSWAKELGKFNIRVIGIAPGINEPTPMGNPTHVEKLAYTRGIKANEVKEDYTNIIPIGRVGKLQEIADLISYLNSEHSSYITGTIINITGGKSRG